MRLLFRYRATILEVIDKCTAKVGLVDVGNFCVIRNIKEIFRMPSKYSGKSLVSYTVKNTFINTYFVVISHISYTHINSLQISF